MLVPRSSWTGWVDSCGITLLKGENDTTLLHHNTTHFGGTSFSGDTSSTKLFLSILIIQLDAFPFSQYRTSILLSGGADQTPKIPQLAECCFARLRSSGRYIDDLTQVLQHHTIHRIRPAISSHARLFSTLDKHWVVQVSIKQQLRTE